MKPAFIGVCTLLIVASGEPNIALGLLAVCLAFLAVIATLAAVVKGPQAIFESEISSLCSPRWWLGAERSPSAARY